jgi:DNA-binding transcriptional MerR regulator
VSDDRSERLLTIGGLARECGLSASALRFYDREGVLVPALVDRASGYRRYSAEQVRAARLIAGLRRVGMPLGEVAIVLEHDAAGQAAVAADIVEAHRLRLEAGLRDALREVARTLHLLAGDARALVSVGGEALTRAIRCVQFAVADSSIGAADYGVLRGILLEVVDGGLRLVATDRHRLAVGFAEAEAVVVGAARVSCVVAPDWLEQVATAAGDDLVHFRVSSTHCAAVVGAATLETGCISGEYPDYRSLLERSRPTGTGHAEHVDASSLLGCPELRSAEGPLALAIVDGAARVATRAEDGLARVDAAFLLEALSAVQGRPTLVVEDPLSPLTIRGSDGGLSLLMPVRSA